MANGNIGQGLGILGGGLQDVANQLRGQQSNQAQQQAAQFQQQQALQQKKKQDENEFFIRNVKIIRSGEGTTKEKAELFRDIYKQAGAEPPQVEIEKLFTEKSFAKERELLLAFLGADTANLNEKAAGQQQAFRTAILGGADISIVIQAMRATGRFKDSRLKKIELETKQDAAAVLALQLKTARRKDVIKEQQGPLIAALRGKIARGEEVTFNEKTNAMRILEPKDFARLFPADNLLTKMMVKFPGEVAREIRNLRNDLSGPLRGMFLSQMSPEDQELINSGQLDKFLSKETERRLRARIAQVPTIAKVIRESQTIKSPTTPETVKRIFKPNPTTGELEAQ